MWLFKTLSNSKVDSLFGWGLKGQSLHVLCQNKDFIRHELSQSCRWVMGLQARGRVADSEIRTKNKPPAGPLFVDLSVLTQQTGTRTDLKTTRRCSFFFFFKWKNLNAFDWRNPTTSVFQKEFCLRSRDILSLVSVSMMDIRKSTWHFYFGFSFQHMKLACLLNSFLNWAHGKLEVCKTKTHCVVMWGVQILTSIVIYIQDRNGSSHPMSLTFPKRVWKGKSHLSVNYLQQVK